jgi:hypothetical protein
MNLISNLLSFAAYLVALSIVSASAAGNLRNDRALSTINGNNNATNNGTGPIDLGSAANFVVLAGSTVTSTGVLGTELYGDLGVFPGSAVTGFPPAILHGTLQAANPVAGTAQGDLTTAYNNAAGRAFTATLSNTDLGGTTLFPGVYKFDAAAAMNGMLTLDALGDPNAVWIFQIGSSLLITGTSSMVFKGGVGNPDYVYWQVGSSATLDGGVSVIGTIMADQSITLKTGATVKGRLLARIAAVALDFNTVKICCTKYHNTGRKVSSYTFFAMLKKFFKAFLSFF